MDNLDSERKLSNKSQVTQPSLNESQLQENRPSTQAENRRESGGYLKFQFRKNSKKKSISRSAPEKLSVKSQAKKDEEKILPVPEAESKSSKSKTDISSTRTTRTSQQFEIPATNTPSPNPSKSTLKSKSKESNKSHPDPENKNENDEDSKVVGVICDRESKSCANLVQDRQSTVELRQEEPLITRHMLYKEALYTSVHLIGKPTNRYPVQRDELCVYSHITFASDPKEQIAVMEHIVNEPFPLTVVNAVVRRAEYLEGRDAKHEGRCNPYCLITIETVESLEKREYQYINGCSPAQRQRDIKKRTRPLAEKRNDQLYDDVPVFIKTDIQKQTNFPQWDQRFQCLALRPTVDILTIEVWDHLEKYKDEVESAIESSKSSHKKETDSTKKAFPEKKDDFLGKVVIKISEIPVEGEEKWHFLKGHSKKIEKDSGKVLIQTWLTHSFRHGKHHHEYVKPNIMLAHLWDHILQVESARFKGEWNGEIPPAANCLLFQYGLQNGLSEDAQAVIRWNSYTKHNLGGKGTQRRLAELGSTLTRLDQPYRKNSLRKNSQNHGANYPENEVKNGDQSGDGSIGETTPISEDVNPSEMEISMVKLVQDKVIPVLVNHLSESQEKVDDAINSVKYAKGVLTKLDATSANKKVDDMVLKSIREAVRNWYQENFDRIVLITDDVEDYEVIASMAMLMNVVNELLKEGNRKWSPHFWLEVSIDYMPIVYDELEKYVSRDVEHFCTRFLQTYPYHQDDIESFKSTNKRLRRLLQSKNHGFEFNRAFKNLYTQTRKFVQFQVIFQSSSKPHYPNIIHYHRWFRPILILWLGFAFIKATDIIYKAIEIDDNVIEDKLVKHSSSAVDTASVYYSLENFWKELKWPDLTEGYVVLKFLLETMCYISILYARMKRMKLENEGYFDTEDRFDISPRLCTALNNIEFVKEALLKIPQEIELGKLMNNLEKEVGTQMGGEKKKEIEEIFNFMLCKVEKQFRKVWQEVGNRLRFDIKESLEKMMILIKEGKHEQEALDPLLSYLEPNIITFKTHLMDVNFAGSLEMIWMVVCQEMFYKIINKLPPSKGNQTHYLNKIEKTFPILIFYFEGGGGGLTKEQLDTQEFQKIKTSIDRIRSGKSIENS